MSEFHYNLTSNEIEDLIKDKTDIYGDNFRFIRFDAIEITPKHFIHQAITRKYNPHSEGDSIPKQEFRLFRYIGMHEGIDIYHFYNIVPI